MIKYRTNKMGIQERQALEVAQMNIAATDAAMSIAFVTLAESGTIDGVTAGEHMSVFAQWEPDVEYVAGNLRTFSKEGAEQKLYKCIQNHRSQSDWTPDTAASLWVCVSDPAEEWPEWSQPVGAHDAYSKGDKCYHRGNYWISEVDGNVWTPGIYGWEKVFPVMDAR